MINEEQNEVVFFPSTDLWTAAFVWWNQKQPKALTFEGYLKNPTAGVTEGEDKILAAAVARGIVISRQTGGEYERSLIEERNHLFITLVSVADAIEAGEPLTKEMADMIREQTAR